MSDDRVFAPEPGEQISFEAGDCANYPDPITVRVKEVNAGRDGWLFLMGWVIGGDGFPVSTTTLRVWTSALESRRKRQST